MATKSGSRHLVKAGDQRMETPHRKSGVDLEEFRPDVCGLVHIRRNSTLSALVLLFASISTGAGCPGSDMAEAMTADISLDSSALDNSKEDLAPEWDQLLNYGLSTEVVETIFNLRKTDHFLVCFGSTRKVPQYPSNISKWIVEAISVAYKASQTAN